MKSDLTLWDAIKLYYKQTYNVPTHVIDLIAVQDILKKCAIGYGNVKISYFINDRVSYVEDVVHKYFTFTGWNYDLDFSPLALFNRTKDYESYVQEVTMFSNITSPSIIRESYNVCKKYNEIVKEIEKFYGRAS